MTDEQSKDLRRRLLKRLPELGYSSASELGSIIHDCVEGASSREKVLQNLQEYINLLGQIKEEVYRPLK